MSQVSWQAGRLAEAPDWPRQGQVCERESEASESSLDEQLPLAY